MQGALSDRFGRRPVILLSCLGLGLDFILMAVAHSLPMLLLARVISGVCSASFSTANAYIADVTASDQRAGAFGMLGPVFGIGLVAGPLIGGWLGSMGLRWPFWFAAGLALLNVLYGWFVLPESLPVERRTARLDWSHANPLGALKLLRRYPQVFGLASVVFLANLAHYVYPSIFVLFAGYQYHWGPREVSWVLAGVGVCSIIVNVLLVGRLVRWLGEPRALLLGLGCGVIGFVIYGLADSGAAFLIGVPISALWALAAPSAQALITREVGADAQGRVQGAHRSGQPGRHRRPAVVRQCVRLVYRQRCATASARRTMVAGRCAARRRLGHGLETGRAGHRHRGCNAGIKTTYSACARVRFF